MNNEFINLYVNFLKHFIDIKRPMKVVFDCSNGVTGLILKKLFTQNSKLTAHYLNSTPDGNFPAHGPDPLKPGALSQLQLAVNKHKADLGIIFDADGDRVFFIDNKSQFIHPDVVARLLVWHLKPLKLIIGVCAGWLIKKLKISTSKQVLYRTGKNLRKKTSFMQDRQKLKIIESRVGHYFFKKIMRKNAADLGVEHSGHYYFKKFFYADSGILAAIEVINAVSKLPYQLSDFVDFLPAYYRSGEMNFSVKNKNKEKLLTVIEKKYKNQAKKISKIDGLTMEFNDWWFNLRPSNTEPLIRLNIEATSKELLIKKTKELKELKNFGKLLL